MTQIADINSENSNQLVRLNAGSDGKEEDHRRVNSQTQRSSGFSDVSSKMWFTVGVLCFINLINYMDRFTIAGKYAECSRCFLPRESWKHFGRTFNLWSSPHQHTHAYIVFAQCNTKVVLEEIHWRLLSESCFALVHDEETLLACHNADNLYEQFWNDLSSAYQPASN